MSKFFIIGIMAICLFGIQQSYAIASDIPNQLITTIQVTGWDANLNIIYFSGQSVDGQWKYDYKLDASTFGGVNDARCKFILALLLTAKQNSTVLTINADDATTPRKVISIKTQN